MRWLASLAVLVATGVAAASPAALPAAANGIERIPVRAAGPTAFAPGLTLALTSPPRYASGPRAPESGRWIGPRYDSVSTPGLGGNAAIDWSVALDTSSKTTDAAALAATTLGFPEDQRGGIAIPHIVGKTQVGTILGFYVLEVAWNTPDSARAEAAVAFPLAKGVYATARFALLEPPSDDFRIEGGVSPTSWNRGQAFIAAASFRVEGNFLPTVVSIRAQRGSRALRGKVVDSFGHKVLGAQVSLERRVGSSWRPVGRARTGKSGTYAFTAPLRGRYRVTATVATTTIVSTSVAVR